jgi:hypothetical protein
MLSCSCSRLGSNESSAALDVKALVAIFAVTLSSYAAVAALPDLGLLTKYYHDCPASHGQQASYLRAVITRALRGDEAAMRRVIMHEGVFATGDNEGFSEVPQALLRTLGDDHSAAFVLRQPREIQELALAVYPEQIHAFERNFPKTAKLYRERFLASHETSNQWMKPTARRWAARTKDELSRMKQKQSAAPPAVAYLFDS